MVIIKSFSFTRVLAATISVLLSAPLSHAAGETFARSGLYDNLSIVVSNGEVTGAFNDKRIGNGTETAPQFSCAFMLKGKLDGNHASIITWIPGDKQTIAGELTFTPDGATLKLKAAQDGCAMTSGDMVSQAFEVTRGAPGDGWIGLAMVTSKKAIFRKEPGAAAHRTPFVLHYDAVVVLARNGDWVKADYVLGDKPVIGWLPVSDLAFDPPAK
jgi:hypothetical protein